MWPKSKNKTKQNKTENKQTKNTEDNGLTFCRSDLQTVSSVPRRVTVGSELVSCESDFSCGLAIVFFCIESLLGLRLGDSRAESQRMEKPSHELSKFRQMFVYT